MERKQTAQECWCCCHPFYEHKVHVPGPEQDDCKSEASVFMSRCGLPGRMRLSRSPHILKVSTVRHTHGCLGVQIRCFSGASHGMQTQVE